MSNIQNERWIESMWGDFLEFLSQENFVQCLAIKDAAGENGFENDALKMFRMVNEKRGNPTEAEDIAAGHEDPRDVADRTNSGL